MLKLSGGQLYFFTFTSMKLTHVLYAYLLSLLFGSLIVAIILSSAEMFWICIGIAFITSLPFLGVFMFSNYLLKKNGKGFGSVQGIHVVITAIYLLIFAGTSGDMLDRSLALMPIPYFICGVCFQAFYYFRDKKEVANSDNIA